MNDRFGLTEYVNVLFCYTTEIYRLTGLMVMVELLYIMLVKLILERLKSSWGKMEPTRK